MPSPPSSTLFPYTTLFRSLRNCRGRPAAVLWSDPGAGVRAGAGAVLDGSHLHLCHGGGHRYHGCRDRLAGCGGQGVGQAYRRSRSEEHTSELQSLRHLVCRLLPLLPSFPTRRSSDLSAIVAVGLRPCSGAILVLVFALAQGLFWTGVISTFVMAVGTAITVAAIASLAVAARAWAKHIAEARSGYGMLAMRAIEVGAAVMIIAFGTLLLTGYMVTERMVGI